MGVLDELGVPRDASFYICGPSAFISDLTAGLAAWGIVKGQVRAELFGRRSIQYPRRRPFATALTASACRASRCGAADFVRPEWLECPLGSGIS